MLLNWPFIAQQSLAFYDILSEVFSFRIPIVHCR